MGLQLIRQDDLDAGTAHLLAGQRLAEITHLPTGTAGSGMRAVSLPPGAPPAAYPGGTEEAVLHVVSGTGVLSSGAAPASEIAAGPGDTVLVPAGLAFRVLNASPGETLLFILVRFS